MWLSYLNQNHNRPASVDYPNFPKCRIEQICANRLWANAQQPTGLGIHSQPIHFGLKDVNLGGGGIWRIANIARKFNCGSCDWYRGKLSDHDAVATGGFGFVQGTVCDLEHFIAVVH